MSFSGMATGGTDGDEYIVDSPINSPFGRMCDDAAAQCRCRACDWLCVCVGHMFPTGGARCCRCAAR
jgi:hypothetical protein